MADDSAEHPARLHFPKRRPGIDSGRLLGLRFPSGCGPGAEQWLEQRRFAWPKPSRCGRS